MCALAWKSNWNAEWKLVIRIELQMACKRNYRSDKSLPHICALALYYLDNTLTAIWTVPYIQYKNKAMGRIFSTLIQMAFSYNLTLIRPCSKYSPRTYHDMPLHGIGVSVVFQSNVNSKRPHHHFHCSKNEKWKNHIETFWSIQYYW